MLCVESSDFVHPPTEVEDTYVFKGDTLGDDVDLPAGAVWSTVQNTVGDPLYYLRFQLAFTPVRETPWIVHLERGNTVGPLIEPAAGFHDLGLNCALPGAGQLARISVGPSVGTSRRLMLEARR